MTVESPAVGHVSNHDRDDASVCYCGRRRRNDTLHHFLNTPLGEGGQWGNHVTDYDTNAEAVARFRPVFEAAVENDPDIRNAVRGLYGRTLVCYCHEVGDDPHDEATSGKPCHADVIAEICADLQRDGKPVLIAGSRGFGDGIDDEYVVEHVGDALDAFDLSPGEVVSGTADGADRAGELWAAENDIPVQPFPARWQATADMDDPPTRSDGVAYDPGAGKRRSVHMLHYVAAHGGELVAFWDGDSPGTRHTIQRGREILGEENVHVNRYRGDE